MKQIEMLTPFVPSAPGVGVGGRILTILDILVLDKKYINRSQAQ